MTRHALFTRLALSIFPAIMVGCGTADRPTIERRPRPVVTQTLVKQLPPNSALVTASANSWKTENLAFEVAGRIEFVAEQNTPIAGRVRDSAGNVIVAGTPVARIESERYQLTVTKAAAAVTRAEQDLIAAQTDLDETIPAQISAARASVDLAQVEYDRSNRLRSQNAGSQSALDKAKANYESAVAELKQLTAAQKTQTAQIASLKSAVQQAKQDLRDARRDLEDCTLYASFDGIVSETSTVPGSLVSPGTPVITLQMMDPIKVELEVSGNQSRSLRRTEKLPVHVTMPDGRARVFAGFLHQIDPSADPRTRTFTLTILLLNQRERQSSNPPRADRASTRDIWRLDLAFVPGAKPGDLYVEENAILEDSQGPYLWQITNATIQGRTPNDRLLHVRKLRVARGLARVPYLGELIFQQVTTEDPKFVPTENIVIGKLHVDSGTPNQWNGDKVLLDSPNRWMLRPGDLVKVDLSGGKRSAGYYVPMDAICRQGGKSFLYVVNSSTGNAIAKRIPIDILDAPLGTTSSSLRRIEPSEGGSLAGVQYVTKGAHLLVDGETVNLVSEEEVK